MPVPGWGKSVSGFLLKDLRGKNALNYPVGEPFRDRGRKLEMKTAWWALDNRSYSMTDHVLCALFGHRVRRRRVRREGGSLYGRCRWCRKRMRRTGHGWDIAYPKDEPHTQIP